MPVASGVHCAGKLDEGALLPYAREWNAFVEGVTRPGAADTAVMPVGLRRALELMLSSSQSRLIFIPDSTPVQPANANYGLITYLPSFALKELPPWLEAASCLNASTRIQRLTPGAIYIVDEIFIVRTQKGAIMPVVCSNLDVRLD